MAATAAQIAETRRRTNEPTTTTYSDVLITAYIEAYPCLDERGEVPYTWDTSTSPPTKDDNDDWIDTYDLAAAAADIWSEKAAVLAADYDIKLDSGSYTRSQGYEQAQMMARFWRSRRKAQTSELIMSPDPGNGDDPSWVIN